LADYWKLKAIDSFETLNEFSKKERQRFIDSLIDDHNIKKIIAKEYSNPQMNNLLMQKSAIADNQWQFIWFCSCS
jgi:hypothetical protein